MMGSAGTCLPGRIMSRSLGYADAVRLLGGADSRIVSALEKITGGLMLGGAIAAPALLAWFDAKADFVRLCNGLVRSLSERRSGLSRYGRTQRLEAAHAVIVVAAFFEGLQEAELPFRFGELELTKAEQVAVAGGGGSAVASSMTGFVDRVLSAGTLLPGPQYPHEDLLEALHDYYADLAASVGRFVAGLAVWDRLSGPEREQFSRALGGVPTRACVRYEELFRRLAVDFPEVACWMSMREHQATRVEIRSVDAALAQLEITLNAISTGRAPDERRAGLTRAYQASLQRPIVESGEVPEGLDVPTLCEAYVVPRFRAADVLSEVRPSDESWWANLPVRDDLQDFLIGYLTSPQATRAPLLVLGQPGSGKSVLTRVLAARLPAADFIPVRVILRDVPAAADLQDQLEQAIRAATGDRVEWPALVRSAGDALPVVLLDGFDELLQAVGVSQTDYLIKVSTFQRREADQGRPVAVVVTSRTAVADRARAPEETVALRLEPFDDVRIAAWLDIWNTTNAHNFTSRGLSPLPAETVLAHRALAEQPLLLLMLALYDANGNALQRVHADLRQHELYERLLRSFASREVGKHRPGLPERALEGAVDEELRRLSVVAFAMFNRSSLWVTEADLESDLSALFGTARSVTGQDLRTPLHAAELTLGRFFFIHRARASQDFTRLETYEFLHATFGEFLVARLTWQVLCDMAAREAASTMSLSAGPVDDDLLRALLSFAPLSLRTPNLDFLTEMASLLDAPARHALTNLVVRLFRVVHETPPARRFGGYQPRPLPDPARYATYSANLVLLTLCVAGTIRVSELYGPQTDVVETWLSQTLLWRSQFSTDGWTSLLETVPVERLWNGQRRDIELGLHLDDDVYRTPIIDPYWTFDIPPDSADRTRSAFTYHNLDLDTLRRKAYFHGSMIDDLAQHALEPLSRTLGITISTFAAWWQESCPSAAHALIDLWLLPLRDATADERRAAYERCARIAVADIPSWDDSTREGYAALLLDRLATDEAATPTLAADVLELFHNTKHLSLSDDVAPQIVRCALAFLGLDRDSDLRLADVLDLALMPDLSCVDAVLGVDALVRLAELDLPVPPVRAFERPDRLQDLLTSVAHRRPDLAERLLRIANRSSSRPDSTAHTAALTSRSTQVRPSQVGPSSPDI
jgi:hypothetical protein